MFHSTKLRLALGYLSVIMLISIGFSAVLYRVSASELDRGLKRQTTFVIQYGPYGNGGADRFEAARKEQYEDSRERLIFQLVYVNLAMLVVGGFFSYWLAKRSLDPLEEAVEAQVRFTGDAAHELRTPLTAMRTEIEVTLRDKNLSLKDAKDVLKSNIEEIDKLEKLTNALLRLAKNGSSNTGIRKHFKLAKVVAKAWERVETSALKRNIALETEVDEIYLYGDEDQITELFAILFDNAVKYGKDSTYVRVEADSHEGEVSVKIKDQGEGIKSSDLPHIFERFFRADQSRTKNKVEGYGLGLSLAEQIVKSHQGTISAQSEYGKGTEFEVNLPLKTTKR